MADVESGSRRPGAVVRPALLWNDTRSAQAAADLITELGGPQAWAEAVGGVPVASFTVTKLRWLAEHEPDRAKRTATVMLPHDWLTWRLGGGQADPVTDRGDASGTGYWSSAAGEYRPDLLERAFGHLPRLPRVLGPQEPAGRTHAGRLGAQRRPRAPRLVGHRGPQLVHAAPTPHVRGAYAAARDRAD